MYLNPRRDRLRRAIYGRILRAQAQGQTLSELEEFVTEWVAGHASRKPDIFSMREWTEVHVRELVQDQRIHEVPWGDRGGEPVFIADSGRGWHRESDRMADRATD